jgi:hypothetical protein
LSVEATQESVTAVCPTGPLVANPVGVEGAVTSGAATGCTTLVGADHAVVDPEAFEAITATRIV